MAKKCSRHKKHFYSFHYILIMDSLFLVLCFRIFVVKYFGSVNTLVLHGVPNMLTVFVKNNFVS